jgi:hypothetical protein
VNRLSTTEPGAHWPEDPEPAACAAAATGDGRGPRLGDADALAAGDGDGEGDTAPAPAVAPGLHEGAGALVGSPGIAVPSAVAGSGELAASGVLPPPPENAQASRPSRPRPEARVSTRRFQ